MTKKLLACAWIAASLLALVVLAGCAVQARPGGRIEFAVDDAELLGVTLGMFRLADGGEGRLRVFDGRFSLKLQSQLKVVPIPDASSVKLVGAQVVGDRTLVVLDKSERHCAFRTQVLAIRGTEVLTWDIGDCAVQPEVAFGADAATFDFVQAPRVVRFTYRDARLLRSDLPRTQEASGTAAVAAPTAPAAPQPRPTARSQARYVPGPPIAIVPPAAPAPLPAAATPSAPSTAAVPVRHQPARAPAPPSAVPHVAADAPAPKALEFPAQEQKPVRIVLDK